MSANFQGESKETMLINRMVVASSRHPLLVLCLVLLGCGAGLGYALFSQPTYASTSSLMIAANQPARGGDVGQIETAVQGRMATYYYIVKSPAVLEPVIMSMRLDTSVPDLSEQIDVNMPPLSSVLEITVKNKSREGAMRLADEISVSASKHIRDTFPAQVDKSASIVVYTLGTAAANTEISKVNPLLAIVLGGLLGAVLGSLFALFRESKSSPRHAKDTIDV